MAFVRLEEFGEIAADAVLAAVAERLRGGRINRQDRTSEIVRADQAEAALDELAVTQFTVGECGACLLPCRRNPVEGGAVAAIVATRHVGVRFATVLIRHWLIGGRAAIIVTRPPARAQPLHERRERLGFEPGGD